MNHRFRAAILRAAVATAVCLAATTSARQPASVAFTVSAADRAAHLCHVVMRCDDLTGERTEFRMPGWTPGYYGIFDFAANVRNFRAAASSQTRSPAASER